MEVQVTMPKKEYDNLIEEIEELKKNYGTMEVTKTRFEDSYSHITGYNPCMMYTQRDVYKSSKEVIDHIRDETEKKENAEIIKLQDEMHEKNKRIQKLRNDRDDFRKKICVAEKWKNLSLFKRVFKRD